MKERRKRCKRKTHRNFTTDFTKYNYFALQYPMATTNNYLAGTVIEIQPTENVQIRFPELAQSFGIIVGVPQHPSTWYVSCK